MSEGDSRKKEKEKENGMCQDQSEAQGFANKALSLAILVTIFSHGWERVSSTLNAGGTNAANVKTGMDTTNHHKDEQPGYQPRKHVSKPNDTH